MPYGMATRKARGDPFLGSIVKGIGKVVGAVLPGPIGTIGRIIGGSGGGGSPAPPSVAMPGGALFRGLGPTSMPAQTYAGAGYPRKRRRMNYTNQKALRRSLRRVTGYARQQKAVRKAASEFAREFGPKRRSAKRDYVVPRHTVVR